MWKTLWMILLMFWNEMIKFWCRTWACAVHLSYTVIYSCGTGCEQLMIISQCISQCIPARVSVHKSGQSGRVTAWVWNENKVAGYTYILNRYRLLCMLCTIGICKDDGVDYKNTKCISLWNSVNLHNLHKDILMYSWW